MIYALINITVFTLAVASQINYSVTYNILFLSNISSPVIIPVYGQVLYVSAGKLETLYSQPAVVVNSSINRLIIKTDYSSPILDNVTNIQFLFTPSLFYKQLDIKLYAPPGWGIVNNSFSLIGSRYIFTNNRIGVEWKFLNQTPFSIYSGLESLSFSFSAYPLYKSTVQFYFVYLAAIFAGIIAVVYAIFAISAKFSSKKSLKKGEKRVPLKLILSDDEKKVFSMLKKGEYIWQDELRERTGFSKIKLSKIISKLESLDVIKVQRIGKYNKIKRK